MKCSECGFENPAINTYCGGCGRNLQVAESGRIPSWLRPTPPHGSDRTATDDSMGGTERYPEKRLKLPRWLWWVKTEIIVRPHSEEYFIESRSRVLGAKQRTVNSKAHWVAGGILITSVFIAMTIFSIWLSVKLGVWWAGLVIEIPNCLAFLPSIVVFFWSLSPPD